ncbi:glycoside hydrolase family 3 C-terminal domain-containing protein [Streptomyces sp. NBC_01766]|uniref:glycoside hydrolase family 3 C-terminal domain-containing protein n=1 Tax=Streptomyces sp. NBC_01766 TaxID=2975936 RepID=UPI002DD7C02D|nr:glycoside hydrolase family 3 C-terminal domain-containing protein [Streptomyces sp. NBC_01766]WSC18542.1 glycoside hydrolase family 3 C-terminal domain-containing protein [Streptomyces sp. NBC_01766]
MTDEELDALVASLGPAGKVRLLTGASGWRTQGEPAVGLRPLVTSDGPVGVRGESWDERETSLVLPSPTALAAAWDEQLAQEMGGLLAFEARRKGVDVLLAPTLNLHRTPLGGRHFECYAEDPLLTPRTGAAVIRGVQEGGVAATAKHFVANDAETDRLTVDVRVGEQALREVYLAPFEAAVDAGVWVVMSAYNRVNGATMSASPLLAEPLKGAWGFDGVVVSDWGAVRSTVETARAAQDLAMPGPESAWGDALLAAVRTGAVAESALDDKVRRLLRLADRVGALGAPAPRWRPVVPESHRRALLRKAVAAGTVLVRNTGSAGPVLPLDPGRLRTVAVIGPRAAEPRIQGGGSAEVFPARTVSPLAGIRQALGPDVRVLHAPGVPPERRPVPLSGALARNPMSGQQGVLVRLLDAEGAELHAEHRLSGRIVEPARVDGAATVEIRALLRPGVTGEWTLAVGGFGLISLAVDGRTVLAGEFARDTDDPTRVHVSPPYRRATLPLTAGQGYEVVARRGLAPDTGVATVLAAAPPPGCPAAALAEAVSAARAADAVVLVVGTTEATESEGSDRGSLSLPDGQDALVRAVSGAHPDTVVLVNSGGPVALPWREEVAALLIGWFPGQEAGHGLADVLLGRAEPGGRLPTTWPVRQSDVPVLDTVPDRGALRYDEGLHIGYRAWLRGRSAPAYWFGHGLGYTSWQYERLDVPRSVAADGSFEVRVQVRNTGGREGREVVQVYLARPETTVERPARWLAGHAAVRARPGETAEAVVRVDRRALEHWSVTGHGWRTEPGGFTVYAGRSAGDLPLTAEIRVPAPAWQAAGERSETVTPR